MEPKDPKTDGGAEHPEPRLSEQSSDPLVPEGDQGAESGPKGAEGSGRATAGEVVASRHYRRETAAFAGPLPPPAMLREYDEVLSGMAERLLTMAEKEQAHRQKTMDGSLKLGQQHLRAAARESLIGQGLAFTLAMTAILGGIVLVALDKPVGGIATINWVAGCAGHDVSGQSLRTVARHPRSP